MMQFHHPPPPLPNMAVPPPPIPQQSQFTSRFPLQDKTPRMHFYQPYRPYPRPGPDNEFDGKRLRKSVMRKTVDYNSSIIKMLEGRVWQRDFRDYRALQPDLCYYPELYPPPSYVDNAINSVTTRFVKTATNKMRCPIFCLAWTPEGRRLVTGASSGEFTLWNGLTFNFETILQAHDSPVRTMVWSHNDVWMVTGDHSGYVKYWQSNMNNVKMFQAHKEAIRGLSFSPTDQKFATCSDDGTIRIWDFYRCNEERILRGHGADVKCCHWHPQKGLIISGSKDNQQPVKLWDPKTGQSLATLHAHKSTVMDIKWNQNGNWLVTASRDHLLKLFDLRNLSQEVQTFRGHKKEASSVAWHPYHEGLFCSGGSDGAILFWHVGADKEVGAIEQAHDSIVWALAWHPLGHILCSGSNDHTSKFWTRNRPGDAMTDKYNLNTLPAGAAGQEDTDIGEETSTTIPGMGPEDRVEILPSDAEAQIPGLDFENTQDGSKPQKKVPYAKPIPKNFQAQWDETKLNEDGKNEEGEDSEETKARRKDVLSEAISHYIESNPPPGVIPVSELQPNAIIVYGKVLPVEPGSQLATAIAGGAEELHKLITSGEIEELRDVIPSEDNGSINGEKNWNEDIDPWCVDDNSMQSNEVTGVARGNFDEHSNLPSGDQDMRSIGGNTFEGVLDKQEPQLPFLGGDQDLRVMGGDQDFRNPHPGLFERDQDLRKPPSMLPNPPHPSMLQDRPPPMVQNVPPLPPRSSMLGQGLLGPSPGPGLRPPMVGGNFVGQQQQQPGLHPRPQSGMIPPLLPELTPPSRPGMMDSVGRGGQFANMGGRQGSPAGRRPPGFSNHDTLNMEKRDVDLRGGFNDYDQRSLQFGAGRGGFSGSSSNFSVGEDMDDRRDLGGLPMRESTFDRGRGSLQRGGGRGRIEPSERGDRPQRDLWGGGPNGASERDTYYDDKDERESWRREEDPEDFSEDIYDDDFIEPVNRKQGPQPRGGFQMSRDDFPSSLDSRGKERNTFGGGGRGGFDSGYGSMRGDNIRGGPSDNPRGGPRSLLDTPVPLMEMDIPRKLPSGGGRGNYQNSRSFEGGRSGRGGKDNRGRGSSGRSFNRGSRGGRGGRGRGGGY